MADDNASDSAEVSSGGDMAATVLALAGASREEADAFLRDQRHHLREQLKLLRLGIAEKRWGVFLRVATAFMGVAIAAGLGFIIWDAAHAQGLLIEPFSVPPDLASHGVNGQMVASQLLDKLNTMQSSTQSNRPPQSYSNNWGNDLKVEIPETGVSIGELRSALRDWLGHDTHISGEVWRTASGLAVTVRASGNSGETLSGTEADLDGLMQQVAESVYRATQPYRYANYLDRNTLRPGAPLRVAEAEAIYHRLIYDPNPVERAWAWNGLGNLAWTFHGNEREAVQDYVKANAIAPIAVSGEAGQENTLGHLEAALALYRKDKEINTGLAARVNNDDSIIANYLGDYAEEFRLCRFGVEMPFNNTVYNHDYAQRVCIEALAGLHDGAGTRAWLRDMPPLEAQVNNGFLATVRLQAAAHLEDWAAVVASEPAAEKTFATFASGYDLKTVFGTELRPLLALAKARLGDIASGEAVIATTPSDCYACVRIRGLLAAEAKEPGRADYWFARAVQQAPSLPFAYGEWGQSMLDRGDPDGAIAKFTIASEKGPHFADPLEAWGEALMKKNRSDLAVAKFTEAEKYAPNWGRLHLKWGEALGYTGRTDEAQKQYALAAGLDLSSADKTELAKVRG